MTPRDELLRLEREVSERVGRAFEAFRDRLSDILRESHESTVGRLGELENVLPERLFDEGAIQEIVAKAAPPAPAEETPSLTAGLLEAVRELDRSRSQSEVLSALLQGSAAFSQRSAFLLLRGDRVDGWGAQVDGEVRSLASEGWDVGRAFSELRGAAGVVVATPETREELADRLGSDGGDDDDGVLIPFVLRDAVAGVLYADGIEGRLEALQLLTYMAAQAVEVLPFRKREATATLLGEPLPTREEAGEEGELAAEPESEAEAAFEVEPEFEPEAAAEAEEAIDTDPGAFGIPEEVVEEAGEEIESVGFAIEEEPEPEPSFEMEDEAEPSFEEEEVEPETAGPEIEDASTGGWTLEEAPTEEAVPEPSMPSGETPVEDAMETAPLSTTREEEVEVVAAEEPTWAEPPAETAPDELPPLELDEASELDSTGPEAPSLEPAPAPVLTGQETVMIPSTRPLSPEVEPPPTERPSTEVAPPEDLEPPSTEVAPPADLHEPKVSESPLVAPPDDLEGPGKAFATTRLPIDAEQVQAHEEARRLARLLVSEIKLYNEEEVEEGRRTGDVYARLKEDIDRSRQMYEERIDPEVRESTDYFYQELVRILGGGDADALGM